MHDLIDIIGPHIPALRRYARALTRDVAAADDLVQDALEMAVSRWHQRRADGDARAWLFAIVHNKAVSAARQRQRRGAHIPWEEAGEIADDAPPAQEGALERRDVMAALADLPEDQRAVLLLVAVEGLSYAEVAQVLSIPPGTVMSRLSRGRERLRERLSGGDDARAAAPGPGRPILRRVK